MKLGKRLQIFLLSSLFLMWSISLLLKFLAISGWLAHTFFLAAIPLASGSFLIKGIQLMIARGCQHRFGYLNQKDRTKSIPKECVECKKAVECMFNQSHYSDDAVAEIKKWY